MARRSKTKAKKATASQDSLASKLPLPVRHNYGVKESALRLEKVGFDPRVTDLISHADYFKAWSNMAAIEGHKPMVGNHDNGPAGPKKRNMTIAPLLMASDVFLDLLRRYEEAKNTPKPAKPESKHVNTDEPVEPKASSKEARSANSGMQAQKFLELRATMREARAWLQLPDAPAPKQWNPHTEKKATQSSSLPVVQSTHAPPMSKQQLKLYFTEESGLLGALQVPSLGMTVLEAIFESGFHNVKKLASTSFQTMNAMNQILRILDCIGGGFVSQASHSTMFVAVVPEYTIGDFWRARDLDPEGISEFNWVREWHQDALREESRGLRLLGSIKDKMPSAPPIAADSAALIKFLTTDEYFFATRRVVTGHPDEAYKPSVQREGKGVKDLVHKLYQHRGNLGYIHFDKQPFLDRRLLAIILRGCPKVTCVSIANCPLLHFGDLIPILDEIHRINLDREAKGDPVITTLDFGPAYERGMPYASENASATYGLCWDPIMFAAASGGVYTILLKAFFKARAMGIRNLFDKDCALRHFLFKLPLSPLGVVAFLDACYRIADIIGLCDPHRDLDMKEAIFDMLRIVRSRNYPIQSKFKELDYFNDEMTRDTKHCMSCGYRMPSPFFVQLEHVNDRRGCLGCVLQRKLDTQTHHLRQKRMECMNILFPDHQPTVYGVDAPVDKPGQKNPLVSLENDTSTFENHNADYKLNSLVGLPSLDSLCANDDAAETVWNKFDAQCEQVDIYRRITWMIWDQIQNGTLKVSEADLVILNQHVPRCQPDHYNEVQRPRFRGCCDTHAHAKQDYLEQVVDKEMPGTLDQLLSGDELDRFEANMKTSFW